MNLKKGVIAIALFVFLSLTVYSFANPAEDDSVTKLDGGNTTKVENVENTFPEEENVLETEIDEEEEVTNRQVLTTESSTNRVVSSTNTTTTTVSNATSSTEEDVVVENNNTTTTTEPDTTVESDKTEDYSSIVIKVDTLENMVEEAITTTLETDMDKARDYNETEKIENLVSNINDEETKNNLEKRLGVIYTILDDKVEPEITRLGIANLSHLNEGDKTVANVGDKIRIYVYLNEELSVNPIVKIDGVEKEIKLVRATKMSGIVYINDYVIKETDTIPNGNIKFEVYGYKDNSNNEGEKVSSTKDKIMSTLNPYVNFDTEAPTFNIGNGASFESNTIKVTDVNFDYMIVQDMTTGKKITVNEPVYELKPDGDVENGRFDFIAYDKAGNVSKRTNYYLDNVKPYITGTGMIGENEVEFVNEGTYKSVKLNVIDKNLNKVIVYKDDVEIETKTYAWNADKTTVLEYSEAGIYKIVLSDRAKHEVEYTFTIDTTPAIVGASNILVNGDSNEQREFYATNGDEIYAYVRFDEKLSETPTFTFHNNGNDYVVDSTKVTEKEKNGEYTYSVLFDINEDVDMIDGEITFTLSNIKDIAGNETSAVLKPTNGHKVYLDRTINKASIEYSTLEITNGSVIVTLTFDEKVVLDKTAGTWLDKGNNVYQKSYPKNQTQEIKYQDLAGNNNSVTVKIENIDKTSVLIRTAEELRDIFADSSKLSGKTIRIVNDLDMKDITDWKAAEKVSFTLDGSNKTISNLKYETNSHVAIFANQTAAKEIIIKNVNIENAELTSTGTGYVAGAFFVAYADTADLVTIENCHVNNSKVSTNKYAAGFVGYTAGWNKIGDGPVYSDIEIKDSSIKNSEITGGGSTGAAVAHSGANPDTTTEVVNFVAENNVINGEDLEHTGLIVGTANVGKTILENITYNNNTLLGNSNYNKLYGRLVLEETGEYTHIVSTSKELSDSISNATDNMIIKVKNGIYNLDTMLIRNNINLIGESKEAKIILDNIVWGQASVFVEGNKTKIENLTFAITDNAKTIMSNASGTQSVIKISDGTPDINMIEKVEINNIEIIGGEKGMDIHGVTNAVLDKVTITTPEKLGMSVTSSNVNITNSNIGAGTWAGIGIMEVKSSAPSAYQGYSVVKVGNGNIIPSMYAETPSIGNKFEFETPNDWNNIAEQVYTQK